MAVGGNFFNDFSRAGKRAYVSGAADRTCSLTLFGTPESKDPHLAKATPPLWGCPPTAPSALPLRWSTRGQDEPQQRQKSGGAAPVQIPTFGYARSTSRQVATIGIGWSGTVVVGGNSSAFSRARARTYARSGADRRYSPRPRRLYQNRRRSEQRRPRAA